MTVAVRVNGVLSCGAAAEYHGLEIFGRPGIRRAVRLVDAKAQSVLESAARVLLLTHDLGPVQSQVFVDQVGWVNFLMLRFTYRDLQRRPLWVVAVVRETLAGHRRARER
ncbi:hypothetical protein [Angustibacter luteus]|uniref:Uncharacterized protein n=1 Tax=Angustibacter luteus TaxID=658456 RepID=A0ABW1JB66_9ACTN